MLKWHPFPPFRETCPAFALPAAPAAPALCRDIGDITLIPCYSVASHSFWRNAVLISLAGCFSKSQLEHFRFRFQSIFEPKVRNGRLKDDQIWSTINRYQLCTLCTWEVLYVVQPIASAPCHRRRSHSSHRHRSRSRQSRCSQRIHQSRHLANTWKYLKILKHTVSMPN